MLFRAALLLPVALAAPSSYTCNVGFDGNAIAVSQFQVLSPAREGCTAEWLKSPSSKVVGVPESKGKAGVCRAVFSAASKPLFFDGKEHDATPSADGETYVGKMDPSDGYCYFATRAGIEAYTKTYELLSDRCAFGWSTVSALRTDVVTIGANQMLLCAAKHPADSWQIGWVDTTDVEPSAVAPLPEGVRRALLDASPSPNPVPSGRKAKAVKMTLGVAGTLAEFTDAKKQVIAERIAALADCAVSQVSIIATDISSRRLRALSSSVQLQVEITGNDADQTLSIMDKMDAAFSDPTSASNSLSSAGVTVNSVQVDLETVPDEGLDGGIIALIVIGSLLGLAFVIITPIVLCKPPPTSSPKSPGKQLAEHDEKYKTDESL